ncbi:T9SS type A sorting domain-containing protein, partial [Candidatus Amoebophilus asiaticus]|nr:T9SS type A sorting domain-containing protein [Candidatus Amoebophilus asiaticus]
DVTLASNLTGFNYVKIVGMLSINSYTLSTTNFILGSGGTINQNTGTLQFSETTPDFSGTFNYNTGTTYYDVSSATYVVDDATTYYNLKLRCASGVDCQIGQAITCENMEIVAASAGQVFLRTGSDIVTVNGNVTIGSNSTLDIYDDGQAAARIIEIKGNFTNNGTFDAVGGGEMIFSGTSVQTIGGTSSTTFYDLTINNSGSSDVDLADNAITISNNLAISDGTLDDNGLQITGNGTGTFTMSSGTFLTLGSSATATTFPPSFTSVNITLDANSTVVYNSDAAQTISSTPTYGHLSLVATAGVTKTIDGNVDVDGDLTIGTNNTLDASASNYNVNAASNWVNNGTSFNARNGTVTFDGSTNQSIGGSINTTFYNWTNNNTGTGITLNSAVTTVTNNLTMTDGDVDLNGNNIDLSSTGTIVGETDDSRIKGTSGVITTTRDINAPASLDVGGMGVILTTGSSDNLGSTTIQRGHTPQTGAGNTGIERYYDISPTNNSNLNMTLRFNYLAGQELRGQSETNFVLYRSTDGGSTWTDRAGTLNQSLNYIELASITAFSKWTVSNNSTDPLPIDLLSFTAEVEGNSIRLKWETATETNNDYFTIDKSNDGISFEEVALVDAIGNSNSPVSYTVLDENPFEGVSYYRLKQTDNDGQFEYFPMVPVKFGNTENNLFINITPNPFNNSAQIIVNSEMEDIVLLRIFNSNGQTVHDQKIRIYVGRNNLDVDLTKYTSGVYHMWIQHNEKIIQTKFVKSTNIFFK